MFEYTGKSRKRAVLFLAGTLTYPTALSAQSHDVSPASETSFFDPATKTTGEDTLGTYCTVQAINPARVIGAYGHFSNHQIQKAIVRTSASGFLLSDNGRPYAYGDIYLYKRNQLDNGYNYDSWWPTVVRFREASDPNNPIYSNDQLEKMIGPEDTKATIEARKLCGVDPSMRRVGQQPPPSP